ncbi:MAG: Ig-like domain-containing protein, partial [Xanthomonadales bacterium]|nr:Ig-like domain-containing protein [Xanthomonadales bacterium]
DSFTYQATDGSLLSNTATVQITVNAINLPPVANGDVYATPQDTVLNVAAPGLLSNDADPEGNALTVTVTGQPANGALALSPDGGFSYTPNAGYSGTDAFTYKANDGILDSNEVSVQITVTAAAANLPPVANGDVYVMPQDTVLTVATPGMLGNDVDPEGHALRISTIETQPANGQLSPSLLGGFTYTPNAGFSGTDSFSYRASDNQLDSNIASVQITVTAAAANLPPVANGDVYITPQDTVLTVAAPGVLGNDADPEGHALTVTVTSQPTNGTLAANPNGGFSYTPNAGFSGSDTFTYTANDGALDSNEASVLITVTAAAANLPPVANGDVYATPQDTVLNVAAPGVLANDADPEGHALTVTVTSQPTNGALAPNPNGGFSYTPNAGFSGSDTFTYTANDGALDSNEATVSITVGRAARPAATPVPALGWPGLLIMILLMSLLGLRNARWPSG